MSAPTPLRSAGSSPELDRAARLIEALLFSSAEPVSEPELRRRVPETVALEPVLEALELAYRGRGINLVRVAGGWTFLTAPDLGSALAEGHAPLRKLTRPQLETLAIIAYHQPVTRSEIEEIRGVTLSPTTLDTLLESGWVMPHGRRQTVGRPTLWVTTEAFLIHFGLDSCAELPSLEEFRAAGLLDARMVDTLGSADEVAGADGLAGDEEL